MHSGVAQRIARVGVSFAATGRDGKRDDAGDGRCSCQADVRNLGTDAVDVAVSVQMRASEGLECCKQPLPARAALRLGRRANAHSGSAYPMAAADRPTCERVRSWNTPPDFLLSDIIIHQVLAMNKCVFAVLGGTKKISSFPCQRLDIPGRMCYFFADQMVNENLSTY